MLSTSEQNTLLDLASQTVHYGIKQHQLLQIDYTEYAITLQQQQASFVTLEINKELRGCIGNIYPQQPLVNDVVQQAYNAAFKDPRFLPVSASEIKHLDYYISVLSVPENMAFSSETDLLSQMQPGIDGIILTVRSHQATFLPSVWEQLPEPKQFLQQLKLKAGLAKNFWDDAIEVQTYQVQYFGRTAAT